MNRTDLKYSLDFLQIYCIFISKLFRGKAMAMKLMMKFLKSFFAGENFAAKEENPSLSDIDKYRKAAEEGIAEAQYNLAMCYRKGCGVEKNISEAIKWFHKAAEQGVADAQYNLGLSYELGYGIEKSITDAIKWYLEAAKRDHIGAQHSLGMLYAFGDCNAKDIIVAVK